MTSRIVATMLCANHEALVQDAVMSVLPWLDEICFIDTGSTDSSYERVQALAGNKVSYHEFEWCDDFAAARNQALTIAAQSQATWAMTLDTDERLDFSAYDSRQSLLETLESKSTTHLWLVASSDGTYCKERFVRLPSDLQWTGRTHEALCGCDLVNWQVLSNCTFSESPKTPAQFQHKLQRDLLILLQETSQRPLDPRWWYYLGQTYEGLELHRAAIDAYDRCIRLDGMAEESCWACYTAARCCAALKKFRRAEEYCALGLTRKPSVAELPWMAGWCCYQRGAWRDAVTWSKHAILLAQNREKYSMAVFRHPPAWHEGPYDILRFAYEKLNEPALAEQARQSFEACVSS